MKIRISFLLAPAAFFLDRSTKHWAQRALQPGMRTEALPGLFHFTYVENTGAAFSLLQGKQTLLAIITGVVIVSCIAYLLLQGKKLSPMFHAGAWLMVGGALGNLYDRVFYGAVIDFIELAFIRFPVFNAADCCVCVAFILLTLAILFSEKEKKEHG